MYLIHQQESASGHEERERYVAGIAPQQESAILTLHQGVSWDLLASGNRSKAYPNANLILK